MSSGRPEDYEKSIRKLETLHKIEKYRVENWQSKEMPAYKRHVERLAQLEEEIEHLRRLSQVSLKPESAPILEFTHSEDYRAVTKRNKTYDLTSRQAQMIQILHEAYENGRPNVAIDMIMVKLAGDNRSDSNRWQDTFRSRPEAKRALVKSGVGKGTLRLNI
jgi:hypothetical protein